MRQKSLLDLSPEQRRVISVLLSNWPTGETLTQYQPIPMAYFSGYQRFSTSKVDMEDLYHDSHWVWRQCNAKILVRLDSETSVVLQKFNTRSSSTKNKYIPRPSYKLWNLRIIQTVCQFSLLYCENASVPILEYHPSATMDIEFTLQDLDRIDVDTLITESELDLILQSQ